MAEEYGTVQYSWEAAEFSPSQRDPRWYVWAGVVLLIVAGILIWTHQWFALAVLVMIGVVLWLTSRMEPRQFTHSLTDRGVMIGERLWPYDGLRSFWIANTPDGKVLHFLSNRKYSLTLTLQLGSADVEMIRKILLARLPEEAGRDEDMVDRIGRFLRL